MSTNDRRQLANAINWASFIAIVAVMFARLPYELLWFILLAIPLIGSQIYLQAIRCPHCRELFRSEKRGMREAMRIRPHCPNCQGDLRQA